MKTYKLKTSDKPAANPSVMPFGKYKGQPIDTIPDRYIIMLADDFGQDNQGILPDNRFNFKVPLEIREKAREALKKRGYRKKGSRWEKD
jgi:uncharacterized protein (DUF3820 family)